MLRDEFDLNTKIKDEMKKGLILGLDSRLPIGVVLGYLGYRSQIVSLMQKLSHGTRAYIWNADGL